MSSDRRRVVITGVGMVTPLGLDVRQTWRACLRGQSAVRRIRRFDPTGFPVTIAAEAPDPVAAGGRTVPYEYVSAVHDLKGRLTFAAVTEALAMAGWTRGGARVGVCVGSEAERPSLADVAWRMRTGIMPTARELQRLSPSTPTGLVASLSGAQGPASTVSTACTSSSQAVGEGMLRIRRGEVDAMIVGGVDVLVDPIMISGFALLGALSSRNDAPERASRPFDLDRDGFVLGEGAGFLVLESLERAEARNVEPLAELSGFGCSCNAYRITDSPPDGRGAAQAMEWALQDARLTPEDIGYINAHGTSTPMNDASETAGIHRALGAHSRKIPVSSTKSMMGHLVAACGAVELILSMLAVREGVLPPTINLDNPDPACDLDHVRNQARQVRVRHALTNAFGFGGSNGSLVVSAL